MIPTIQIEEAQFTEVAERVADHEMATASRLARRVCLEETPRRVFGSITLWYLVSSIASLA